MSDGRWFVLEYTLLTGISFQTASARRQARGINLLIYSDLRLTMGCSHFDSQLFLMQADAK